MNSISQEQRSNNLSLLRLSACNKSQHTHLHVKITHYGMAINTRSKTPPGIQIVCTLLQHLHYHHVSMNSMTFIPKVLVDWSVMTVFKSRCMDIHQ